MRRVLFFVLFLYASSAMADDEAFFNKLINENVIETPFSALIKTVSYEPVNDIRTDRGVTGYITYKFIAVVEEVFKGKAFTQIEYYVTYEAGIKPVVNDQSQIISLCFSTDNKLYVPDNGYRIDATDKLIAIARQAAEIKPGDITYNPCK